MKHIASRSGLGLALLIALMSPAAAQSTAYGSCPDRADRYQARYESTGQVADLVCMQKAMERELSGSDRPTVYDCPRSAQHYQTSYERDGRASDLVCMQTALTRELG